MINTIDFYFFFSRSVLCLHFYVLLYAIFRGGVWADDESDETVDKKLFVPAGTAILMDYRTVHRGTANKSNKMRPMAMMIYGRRWWQDSVNYGKILFDFVPTTIFNCFSFQKLYTEIIYI